MRAALSLSLSTLSLSTCDPASRVSREKLCFEVEAMMERDFLGLNSKESVIVVKEETVEGCKDSGSGVPWPLSNKISALPHFMSFKNVQEEKTAKNMSDPLGSSGFITMSTGDAFGTAQKRPLSEIQKNFNHERQGGTHLSVTAFPMQHNNQPLPVSNQTIPVSMGNPFFKNHFPSAGQNFGSAAMKQQLLGGIPITLSSLGSVAGVTEPWFSSKAGRGPAQLTIFYGGTVNVYDDISPEKAQAIMFLAGNGTSGSSNPAQPRAQVQAPSTKQGVGDGVHVNQPVNTPPCSGLSSPISVSSHPIGQPGSGSNINNDDVGAVKSTGVSVPAVSKVDPPKMATSLGPAAATSMIPSAVPQFRKASLARFLEKRKERAMNSAPYNLSKKPDDIATPNGASFSASSGAASGSPLNCK